MGNKIIETIIFGNNDPKMPKNRKKQFKKLIIDNWWNLIIISLLTFALFIPSIITLFSFFYNITILDNTLDTYLSSIKSLALSYDIIMCVFIILGGIGISGAIYVIRKMVYSEVYHLSDFFVGIKKLYKRFILIFFIYGFSFHMLLFSNIYYQMFDMFLYNIIKSISIIQFVFFNIYVKYLITLEVRYDLNIRDLFKNAFVLSFKTLFSNLLFFFISFSLIFFLLMLDGKYQIVLLLIMMFTYLGLIILINMIHSASVFDKYINKDKFPSLYRKGLDSDL